MARNSELVRQWEILREIDAARTGIAIAKLASSRKVHPRTIRRDLDALCRAGFPLYDEKVTGTAMWKLRGKPFRGLEETGLSILEMCALYFSRSLLQTLGGAPFEDEMNRAFAKLERALPIASRRFLDQLPIMLKTKVTGRKKHDERKSREILARVIDASLSRRRVDMRYYSLSSQRTKDYVLDPLRVSCADGGIYLTAWVAEYGELRTFALERIQTLAVRDEQFEPRALPAEPFANSLGVFSGSPEPIEIEFDAGVADFVTSREWHRSQEVVVRDDGSIAMRLFVSNDRPLRTWILGFGGRARVVAPSSLARELYDEFDAALERYAPALPFDSLRPSTRYARSGQSSLRAGPLDSRRALRAEDSPGSLRAGDRPDSVRSNRQLKMWGDADEMRLPFARRA